MNKLGIKENESISHITMVFGDRNQILRVSWQIIAKNPFIYHITMPVCGPMGSLSLTIPGLLGFTIKIDTYEAKKEHEREQKGKIGIDIEVPK